MKKTVLAISAILFLGMNLHAVNLGKQETGVGNDAPFVIDNPANKTTWINGVNNFSLMKYTPLDGQFHTAASKADLNGTQLLAGTLEGYPELPDDDDPIAPPPPHGDMHVMPLADDIFFMLLLVGGYTLWKFLQIRKKERNKLDIDR